VLGVKKKKKEIVPVKLENNKLIEKFIEFVKTDEAEEMWKKHALSEEYINIPPEEKTSVKKT